MHDQATRLRNMMCRSLPQVSRTAHTILVCGSQHGVGATTIATNLSLLIGRRRRVVLETVRGSKPPLQTSAFPEWKLIDGGPITTKDFHRYWQVADEVVLVTTADSFAIMDAYTGIKLNALIAKGIPIRVVINQVDDAARIHDAYGRLDRSCRRFLGLELALGGSVPLDPCVVAAAEHAAPVTQRYHESRAALALRSIAAALEDSVDSIVSEPVA